MTTNQKGALAEAAIAKAATELGIGVFRPYGDERYDLIFDLRPRLVRVQCKWVSCDGAVMYARLYSCRRGRGGMIRSTYLPGEVDAFALYCHDTERCYCWRPRRWALGPRSCSGSPAHATTRAPA